MIVTVILIHAIKEDAYTAGMRRCQPQIIKKNMKTSIIRLWEVNCTLECFSRQLCGYTDVFTKLFPMRE